MHAPSLAAAILGAALAITRLPAQQAMQNPHGKLTLACSTCHTAEGWTPARVSKSYKHADGRFPLEGAHASVSCRACHGSLDFAGVSRSCVACHSDVHRGELGTDCARCHTARSFIDRTAMVRTHQTTRFPLTGAHIAADCEACHVPARQGQLTFVNRATTCDACHLPNYKATVNPDHVAGGFPLTCEQCHTTVAWERARFDHNATRFPLTGAHVPLACTACHADKVYQGKSTLCVSCHLNDFNATTQPPHAPSGFPTDCTTCHTTASWNASFDHNQTLFPLTGAHIGLQCNQCHGDGVYKGKPTTCLSCHVKDYSGTTDPSHSAAAFQTTCQDCHTTASWNTTFDHSKTLFPLTGAHVALDCNQCHADNVYKGKPTTCVSCHLTDYQGTNNPSHAGAGFPTTCQDCHTTTTWAGATFNHDQTFFPIYSGSHRGVWSTCADCHTNPANYLVFTCLTCHTQRQTDSDHQGVSGYQYNSQACYTCHPRGTH